MDSLISSLGLGPHQQQRRLFAGPAAAGSVSLPQALLLQALQERTRQVASIELTSRRTNEANGNHLLAGQQAPLDLSVARAATAANARRGDQEASSRQATARPRHTQARRKLAPASIDLLTESLAARARASAAGSAAPERSQSDLSIGHQSKLITSSTSPLSSSSAASDGVAFLARDANNNNHDSSQNQDNNCANRLLDERPSGQDVISSTNGRQRARPRRRPLGAARSASGKKLRAARSHLCNFCGRSFSRSDMLTRHSRLHSGLKPYQCGKCLQVFSRSDHLSTHERTHTGEKPYQCNLCDYSACRRDMITRHMRIHAASQDGELEPRTGAGRRRRRRRRHTSSSAGSSPAGRAGDNDEVSTSFPELGAPLEESR